VEKGALRRTSSRASPAKGVERGRNGLGGRSACDRPDAIGTIKKSNWKKTGGKFVGSPVM